ncbi:MAG: MATE family efflux transporter [Candidatus Kapabacteria bacterium]|nr:MATE family efflux transporter [Candidatus Kapabacteria bacterium]
MLTSLRAHLRPTLALALPIMTSFAGHMIVVVTDNIMISQYDVTQFAASVFATSVFMIPMITGITFGMGLTPLVGKANGEGDTERIGVLLKNGLVLNGLLALLLLAVLLLSLPFLPMMKQSPDVLRHAVPFLTIIAFSIVPMTLFVSMKQFADGLMDTKAAMYFTLVADALNVVGNYLLVFGNFGFPEMGANGSALSTLVARIFCCVGFAIYLFTSKRYGHITQLARAARVRLAELSHIARMSIPTSLQGIMEVGAFAVGSIMMGALGTKELAAHQIALGLASFTFMMSNGTAVAGSIRVSNFLGEQRYGDMRRAGFAALGISLVFMGCTALLFILLRNILPLMYTDDAAVIAIASVLFIYAGAFQIFDGMQVVMMNALRGIQDVRVPTIIAFVGYWLVALPVGYLGAFTFGLREHGIWLGYLCGLAVAALLLLWRYSIRSAAVVRNRGLV